MRARLGASRRRFVLIASTVLILLYNVQFWRQSLGALGLRSGAYHRERDLIASCRSRW